MVSLFIHKRPESGIFYEIVSIFFHPNNALLCIQVTLMKAARLHQYFTRLFIMLPKRQYK